MNQAVAMLRPALIVHGGAGVAVPQIASEQHAGCTAAVAAGWRLLTQGASALDAVCAAVAALEEAPAFNAGVGSCLTSAGTVEMDASVMEGSRGRAGAVAVVSRVLHPVQLARAIMEDGRHVLLAGPAAESFASAQGIALCEPAALVTEGQLQRWHQRSSPESGGTVGAAAVDRAGHVAAATSTGGTFFKLPGRIGDSAIVGAGTYADDALGAASATGNGEAIMRAVLTKYVVDALRDGSEPVAAARRAVQYLARQAAGSGGVIVVDPLGRFGYACNTPHMSVAYMRSDLPAPVVHP
ncbi:MAG TPA: isoaspartyl peptidase/L-asparaginase family protein [Candidatus Margulisiibacteriota bacterium]|nr:isoaspartyl peptidase/L-asparaginase family protein [Candidatus Margulisiibacteriota bacterium]